MTAKTKPCTLGPKHKYEWKHDTTLQTRPTPDRLQLSRRGVYICACGANRFGQPRSGL